MLLKNHKTILKHIISHWKNNNGQLVVLEENSKSYNHLKDKLNINDDYLKTSISYLENTSMIVKPKHIDKNKKKYIPTPEGLEYNKPWPLRERNYKWYLPIICLVLGIIIGKL